MFLNNNSIFALLILVTTTTSVFGGKQKVISVNVDDYHTCLRSHRTTVAPSQTIQLEGEILEATRHHVIPYSTLSSFFNLILREDPLPSTLGAYLARRVREIYDFFEENHNVGAFPPESGPTPLHSERPITFTGRSATFNVDNTMLAAFTWMPGNIFYGPPSNRRARDPGNNIDTYAERIVGSQAFAILQRIYINMQHYINNPSERTIHNFDAILNDLNEVAAQRNTPYQFNQEDWFPVSCSVTGKKLFGILKRMEIVLTTAYNCDRYLRKIRAVGVALLEDYLNAAQQVCAEYANHLIPAVNNNFTHVDVDNDVGLLFVYSINNKHFVYGQNEKTNGWFIKKLEHDGKVGTLTDQGSWKFYYNVQIPFEINGKHYFFGHYLFNNDWFIRELKDDGTMGRETANGCFAYGYYTLFHISINGQHYLYGQTKQNNNWFLQILNSDGTLGREVSNGEWASFYDIQFTFNKGDNQYISGYNTHSREHYIRDISVNNLQSMGKPNVWVTLTHSYSVFFPFSLGGKTYIFEHDPVYKISTIRHALGDVVEQKNTIYGFTKVHPFNINGYQYFFAKHPDAFDSRWYLLQIDIKYL